MTIACGPYLHVGAFFICSSIWSNCQKLFISIYSMHLNPLIYRYFTFVVLYLMISYLSENIC